MNSRHKLWLLRTTTVLAALAGLYFAWKLLVLVAARAIGILMFLVNVLLPLAVLIVLGWFVYFVFLKKYLRARRIEAIRNARYTKEAVERGDSEGHAEESTRNMGEDGDPSLRSG
jgi:membrane protein implicated in regulation of membrane protease activity